MTNFPAPPRTGYAADDEISLVDLWVTLRRRRALVGLVSLAVLAAGAAFGLFRTPLYEYSTVIEVGRTPEGMLLENPASLQSRLTDGYIPPIVEQVEETSGRSYKVQVRPLEEAGLVALTTEGADKAGSDIEALHRRIYEAVSQRHNRELGARTAQVQTQLTEAERRLGELEEESAFVEQQLVLLEKSQRTLAKRADQFQDSIAQLEKEWQEKLGSLGSDVRSSATLMLVNQINETRNRLAVLEERLNVGIPNERSELLRQRSDLHQRMSEVRSSLQELEAKRAIVRETGLLREPGRSREPTGPGLAVIAALAAILGLMLGVFAAFGAEFLAKARERQQQELAGRPL